MLKAQCASRPRCRDLQWSRQDDELLRRIWGTRHSRSELREKFPGRTFAAIKWHAGKLGLTHPSSPKAWSEQESEKLRQLWGTKVPRAELLSRFPGRTYDALKNRVRVMPGAGGSMRPWNDEELQLARNAARCLDRLQFEHGRSRQNVWDMVKRMGLREAMFERLMAQIQAAAARVPPDVRADVVNAVYVAATAKRRHFKIEDLVKAEVTKAYGRRHYSLDAALGDDSGMNWIDTIESDRPHF